MSGVRGLIDDAEEFAPEPPHPLRRELPPPKPFPLDALGPTLGPAAQAIHDIVRAPASIPAQSVLAAATLAVQARRDLKLPHGQISPLSEYYLTVAESGERKTTADTRALSAVSDRERDLRDAFHGAFERFQNAEEVWNAERQRVLHDKKLDRASRIAALESIGPRPLRPLEPMVLCPEPTFEGLTKLFATGYPSLGLFSSEGGQFIGGYGMSQGEKTKTAAALSRLWDGEPIKRVRSGDGASTLPGRRLAMHLQAQPAVANLLLGDQVLRSQGVLARVLVVAPETAAGTRLSKPVSQDAVRALERYTRVIGEILQLPAPLRPGSQNELAPPLMTFTPEATELFRRLSDEIERQQGTDHPYAPIRAFAAKAAEHAARTAAVVVLVGDPEAAQLGDHDLESGALLADFYLSEWLRLEDSGTTSPELLKAERLLDWLLHVWREPVIGLPEIYQRGPKVLRNKADARAAVTTLESHGWLGRTGEPTKVAGVPRRDTWQIICADGNPKPGI